MRKSFLLLNHHDREVLNRRLLHYYLINYNENTLASYLRGEFRITKVRQLGDSDFITHGIVLEAQAYHQFDDNTPAAPYPLTATLYLPTPLADADDEEATPPEPPAKQVNKFKVGDKLNINKFPHFFSLLNVHTIPREGDDTIYHISAVSLAQSFNPPHGKRFNLAPPKKLNLKYLGK